MKKLWILVMMLFITTMSGCTNNNHNDKEETKAELLVSPVSEITVGDKDKITVTSSVLDDVITYTSSDYLILNVDEFGNFEALKPGEVTITITSMTGTITTQLITIKEKPKPHLKLSVNHNGVFYTDIIYKVSWDFFPISDYLYFTYDYETVNFNTTTGEISFIYSGKYTLKGTTRSGVTDELTFDVNFPENKFVYNLLFLGNSLTKCVYYDIPNLIRLMIEADGDKALVYVDAPGGYYIYQHEDYLKETLLKHQFMYIFLQEQSMGPINKYSLFESSVLRFNDIIKTYGAQAILYQTWVYNLERFSGNKTLQEEMKIGLETAYDQVGNKGNITVSRSGSAFYDCITNYPDINLYVDNNGHASKYGAYLSACVHYKTITGKSPLNNKYNPPGIDEETKVILQTLAENVS